MSQWTFLSKSLRPLPGKIPRPHRPGAGVPQALRAALEQLRARIESAHADDRRDEELARQHHGPGDRAGDAHGERPRGTIPIPRVINPPASRGDFREAIGAADRLVFEYGPPWSVKPFDEVLGELLLADGRREEAASSFSKDARGLPESTPGPRGARGRAGNSLGGAPGDG